MDINAGKDQWAHWARMLVAKAKAIEKMPNGAITSMVAIHQMMVDPPNR
jgi:hypothetical protein